MAVLASESLDAPSGERTWPGHRIGWVFRAHGGGPRSGDRFWLEQRGDALCFAVADAAGHGDFGARFWDRHAAAFAGLWRALVDGDEAPLGARAS